MQMIQAIIPARGGSKGVPRKNALPLGGRPLIAWTIEAARRSCFIDEVFVSTDDSEIAEIAENHGANVIARPQSMSGDLASSEEALLHAISVNKKCAAADIIVFLQCTAPLTATEDIDSTIEVLVEEQADTAVAVTEFHHFLWHDDQTGFVGVNHDASVRELRQAREPDYLETGAVYVARREGLEKHRHRFFGKIARYVTPPERVWEIDSFVDFQVAEVLLRNSKKADAVAKPGER